MALKSLARVAASSAPLALASTSLALGLPSSNSPASWQIRFGTNVSPPVQMTANPNWASFPGVRWMGPHPSGTNLAAGGIWTYSTQFSIGDGIRNTISQPFSFLVDDSIVSARLNGHAISLPAGGFHAANTVHSDLSNFRPFLLPGQNRLELDVSNAASTPTGLAFSVGGISGSLVPSLNWHQPNVLPAEWTINEGPGVHGFSHEARFSRGWTLRGIVGSPGPSISPAFSSSSSSVRYFAENEVLSGYTDRAIDVGLEIRNPTRGTYTVTPNPRGTFVLFLDPIHTTEQALLSPGSITLRVRNVAPIITAVQNSLAGWTSVLPKRQQLILQMFARDPGENGLSFTIDGTPAGFDPATGGTRNSSPVTRTYTQSGVVSIVFSASDGLDTSTVTREITITNADPVLETASAGLVHPTLGLVGQVDLLAEPMLTVLPGWSLDLRAFASDPDADPVTYSWSFDAQVLSGASATLPLPMAVGLHTLTLRVRDDDAGTDPGLTTRVIQVQVIPEPSLLAVALPAAPLLLRRRRP